MAAIAYENECNRAELLGLEKPDFEHFRKVYEEKKAAEEEELDKECLKEVDIEGESLKHVSGGLDELNIILKSTQRHINNFKRSYGSFTNFLREKMTRKSASNEPAVASSKIETVENKNYENYDSRSNNKDENNDKRINELDNVDKSSNLGGDDGSVVTRSPMKSDLAKALDHNVDRLDDLITKAENCQYSLRYQNKQMKAFLTK